jgi:hypothetical protein
MWALAGRSGGTMVRSGVELIVFDGGRVVEWDVVEEDPVLEVLPQVDPEPELEALPDAPPPTSPSLRRRRSFLSHRRAA